MPTKKSNGEPGGASEAQEQRVREQQLIERAVTELVKDKKFQITATTLKKLARGRGRGKEAIAPIDVSGFDWSELVREINRRSRGVEPKNGNRDDIDVVASREGVKPDESKPPKEGGNLEKISKEIDGLAKRIERGKSKVDELLISLDKLEETIHRDASSDDKLLKRIVELRQELIKAEEKVAEVVDDTVEYSGGFPFGKAEPSAVKEAVVVAGAKPDQATEAVGEISEVKDIKLPNRGKYTGKAMTTETGELVPHGEGRIIYPRGGFVEGTFINGLLNGKGRVLLPGRINEVGDFKDDNLDGDGRRVRPDKIVEEGKFTNGFLNGKGVRIYTDGKKEEGTFEKGNFVRQVDSEAGAQPAEEHEVGFDEPEAVEDTTPEVTAGTEKEKTKEELKQEIKDFFKSKNLKVVLDPYCALEKIKTLKEKQEELFTKVIEPLGSELVRKVRFIIGATTMYIRSHKEIIINLNDLNDLDALNKKLRETMGLDGEPAIGSVGVGEQPPSISPEVTKPIHEEETFDKLRQEVMDFFESKGLEVWQTTPGLTLEQLKKIKQKQQELFDEVISPLGDLVKSVCFSVGTYLYNSGEKRIWVDLNDMDDLATMNKKLREATGQGDEGAGVKQVEAGDDDGLEKVVDFDLDFFKKYTGEVKIDEKGEKVPHGQGRMEQGGDIFEGSFENGKLNGSGKITNSDGIIDEGEFKNGRLQGQGKVIAKDGSIMAEGEFVNGMLHGDGKRSHFGRVSEGLFEKGDFVKGKSSYHGKVEEGEFMNDFGDLLLHGQGKRINKDGTVEEGRFEDGKLVEPVVATTPVVGAGEPVVSTRDRDVLPPLPPSFPPVPDEKERRKMPDAIWPGVPGPYDENTMGKPENKFKRDWLEEAIKMLGESNRLFVFNDSLFKLDYTELQTRTENLISILDGSSYKGKVGLAGEKIPTMIHRGNIQLNIEEDGWQDRLKEMLDIQNKRAEVSNLIKIDDPRLFIYRDVTFGLDITELTARISTLKQILDQTGYGGSVGLVGKTFSTMVDKGAIQLNIEQSDWQDRFKATLELEEIKPKTFVDEALADGSQFTGDGLIYNGVLKWGRGLWKGKYGFTREGNFINGQLNGQGEARDVGGMITKGNFIDGELNGEGEVRDFDGMIKKGNFIDGELNGEGEVRHVNGIIKKGNFIDGQLDGQGEIRYVNGGIKKGQFDHGYFMKGFVAKIPILKKVPILGLIKGEYTGEAIADENWKVVPNGEGVLKRKLLRDLSGTWEYGQFVSKGKVDISELEKRHIETGSIDEGEPVVEEEKGQMPDLLLSSGARYTGEVKMDDSGIKVPHGKGKMTYPDGRIEEGRFENGVLVEEKNEKPAGFTKAQKNLVEAFYNRQQKIFGRKKAEDNFEQAWVEYEKAKKELLKTQGETYGEVLDFLQTKEVELSEMIREKFKEKENFIQRAWKKMGDMNLYNFMEKKADEEPESWVGKEFKKMGTIGKMGAKMLSVRFLTSMSFAGIGVYGIYGVATSTLYVVGRSAFVGIAGTFGSRGVMDGLGNFFGGKGRKIFESKEDANEYLEEKKGIFGWLGKKLKIISARSIEDVAGGNSLDKYNTVLKQISDYESYATVNGVDIDKDDDYTRLKGLRDNLFFEILKEKSEREDVDKRDEIKEEDVNFILEFFGEKEKLLDKSKAITSSKRKRWGKRLGSVAFGAAIGVLSYYKLFSEAGRIEKEEHLEELRKEAVATVDRAELSPTKGAGIGAVSSGKPEVDADVTHGGLEVKVHDTTVPKDVKVGVTEKPNVEPTTPEAGVPSEEAPKATIKPTTEPRTPIAEPTPEPRTPITEPLASEPVAEIEIQKVFGNSDFDINKFQKAWNLNKETISYLQRLTTQYPELNNEDALTRMFKVGKDWDIGKGVKSEFHEAFKGMISNPLEAAREADMIKFEEILKAGGDDRATEYLMGRNFNTHSLKNMGIEWDKDPDVVRQRVGDFVSEYKDKVIDIPEGGNKDATLMRKLGDALQHDENRDMYKYKEGGLFDKAKRLFIRRGLVLGMDETAGGDARKLVHSGFERYSGPKLVPEVEVEVQAPVARITADNFGIDRNTLVKVYDGPGGQLRTITLRPDEIIDIKPDGSGNQIATFVDADGKVNKAIFHLKGGVGDMPETIVLEGVQRVAESDLTPTEIASALAKKAGALSPASASEGLYTGTVTGRGVPKVISGGGGGGGVPSEVQDLFAKGLAETKKQISYALTDRKFSSDIYRTFFNTQGMQDEYENFVKSYLTGHPNADLTKSKEAANFIDSWRGYGKNKIIELQDASRTVPSNLTSEQKEMANYLENTESKASSEAVVSDKTGTRVIKQEVGADVGKDKPEVPAVEETMPAEKPPVIEENIATDTKKLIIGEVDENNMRSISVWDSSQDKAVDIKLPKNYEPQIVDGKLQIQINGGPVNGDLVRANVEGKEQWILRTEAGGEKENVLYAVDKLAKGDTNPIGKK